MTGEGRLGRHGMAWHPAGPASSPWRTEDRTPMGHSSS
jgi:hypothetical protein